MQANTTGQEPNGLSAVFDGIASGLNAVGAVLARGMLAVYRANHAHARYEALAALTDAQLEARGLTRDTLVRKVFAEYVV